MFNPLAESDEGDSADAELAERATSEDRTTLESLVLRHQAWMCKIAVRMVLHPHGAEDVTQEVLVKVTRLSIFRRECQFRTWRHRMVANHVLNMRRREAESQTTTFADYGTAIDRTPDGDLPDPDSVPWMRGSWSKRPKPAVRRGCCAAWTAGSG